MIREILRTSLGCLFIALALNAAFTFAQDAPWLQVNTHNPTNDATHLPKWTVIISSKKPSVKQIRENCWEISFYP